MEKSDIISDEDLMARIQRGDHQAFATLVRRHSGMFYACAYRVSGNQDEAEDAVQEAFLKLWKNPSVWRADKGAKFTTWFYRVVVNTATDRLRKGKYYVAGSGDSLERMGSAALAQDEAMQANEEQEALESAIQALPERQKVALNLCFYEGLSNREAAEIMGVNIKALESLLMRAKNGLKEMLVSRGILERDKRYG